MLVKRRSLIAEQRNIMSDAAKQLLISHSLFSSSQHIACYLKQEGEFDCMPIIQEIWQQGKYCYLPVLSLENEKKLDFVRFHAGTRLQLNRYQIFEPEEGEKLSASQLDLVMVPLVAFDAAGHRIGMGGGYYDRTFAFKRDGEKPFLLGLGYEAQKVVAVPEDVWDVRLDGVLTEKNLFLV